jgi:hypothetical protein
MTWTGTWRNQYGSIVTITSDEQGRIEGWFRTAIPTSPFAGSDVPVTGRHRGAAIAFVCGTDSDSDAEVVVSYTGKLDYGRMETLWFVVDGTSDWWTSVTTNHDTFERADG